MKKIEDFELDTLPKTPSQLFVFMLRPYRARAFWFFFLTFLGILAWTGSPVIISEIVNRLTSSRTIDSYIWWLVIAFCVLRVIDEVLWRIAELVMRTFKPQMVERVRSMLFAGALGRSYSYSVNASSGQVGHWINQTRNVANEVVDITIWTVWGRLIGLVIAGVFLFLVHWSLGTIFLVWLTLLFWYTSHRGKRFGQLVALQSEEESKASGIVVDALSNHISVRIYNAQQREKHMLVQQQSRIVDRWRDSWFQNTLTNIVKGQSAAIASGVALIIALLLYSSGTIELGGVVLFVAYFGDASSTLWTLAWALDAYYRNFGTVQNALDGLNGEPARKGKLVPNAEVPTTVNLGLHNVSFNYPDQANQEVLKNIQLNIQHGQKIGIVGHSGAGKSTLFGLLLGFYEPTAGEICINDVSIASKDPSFVRQVTSFVPQDTTLFNRTIRENILYARPDATQAELDDALKKAEAYTFVMKLSKGLDTLVGERGVKLSGGQRQRIAIARAILRAAPLLLLDEATSALDSASEQSIQRALHQLMKNRTTIVIAHRLSTLMHLDSIIVLDKGRIAEQGTHEQLIAQGGIYADLWKRQKDGFIPD